MANASSPVGPANQWALAASAILTASTRRSPRFDCLGGAPPGPAEVEPAKAILKNSWGIEDRQRLESMIEWLATTGHSAEYQKAAAVFANSGADQRQADPRLVFVGRHGQEIGARALLAWDLGRLLAIAGWGYLAGFCDDVEAWGVMLPQAERLRNCYASWDEYGQNYKLGALFTMPDAAGQIESVLAQLRSAPDSPWRSIPFKLGGPNVGQPPYGPAPTVVSAASPSGAGPAPQGAAQYGGAPAGAAPYGGAPPGAAPYGATPAGVAPYGGAPPGAAPYGGGAPMAPAGGVAGAPMVGPAGAKKKGGAGLILGLVLGGLVVLGGIGAVVWHFTHEHPAAHASPPPAHEPGGKGHGRH
jgi:hypothetical protein